MTEVSPTFPDIHLPHLDDVALPQMAAVRLRHPDLPALADPVAAVRAALEASDLFDLASGASVAVAVGSRGIAEIDRIAAAVVKYLKARGFAPFVVPAMGSHGGGTAEGQVEVLAQLGVTEDSVGCAIRSSMETVTLGRIADGTAACMDANAAGADGIVAIGRVKAHTSFPRPVESGLTKMVAVGLGKAEGAREVHFRGPKGLSETLPALAAKLIETAPLIAGLALVENAGKRMAHVEVVAPRDFHAADERLLKMANGAMARLPFDRLDGLIVDLVGKEISGAGIDPNVCGRSDIRGVPNPETPFVHKMVALDVTEKTGGNGIGVGLADYIPRRMAERLNLHAMYMNAITSTIPDKVFIPIVLPDEATCLRALMATCWAEGPPRIARIRSTADLDWIAVTAPLLDELRERDLVLEERAVSPLQFDGDGRLAPITGDG